MRERGRMRGRKGGKGEREKKETKGKMSEGIG